MLKLVAKKQRAWNTPTAEKHILVPKFRVPLEKITLYGTHIQVMRRKGFKCSEYFCLPIDGERE